MIFTFKNSKKSIKIKIYFTIRYIMIILKINNDFYIQESKILIKTKIYFTIIYILATDGQHIAVLMFAQFKRG